MRIIETQRGYFYATHKGATFEIARAPAPANPTANSISACAGRMAAFHYSNTPGQIPALSLARWYNSFSSR